MKFNKNNIFIFLISILIIGILSIVGYNKATGIILFVSVIFINITLIIRSYKKNNLPLLLFFIYTFFYSYVLKYAFIDGSQISIYHYFNDLEHIYNTGLSLMLFFIFLNLFIKIPSNPNKHLINYYRNPFIFILFLIISVVSIIFGKRGDNIFTAGGYSTGANTSSSLNEYFLIFFFIAIMFSNNLKRNTFILYLIAIIYALKNLLYGGRIEVMMIILCVFIWKLNYKMKPKSVIFCAILALYFFGIIGSIRQNPQLVFSHDLSTLLIPSLKTNDSMIILSQEGDVFYATNRLISMVDENIFSFTERIKAFMYFIISIIVPYSYLPEIANLASFKSSIYNVGGGGLVFGPFYVYLSYLGIVLIAYIVSFILSHIGSRKIRSSAFFDIYTIFAFITFPRWFAYSPIVLFKLCIYGALISIIVINIHKWMIITYNSELGINKTKKQY